MRRIRLISGMILLAVPLSAQPGTGSAGFVTCLGRDTIALERVTRSTTKVEGDLVLVVPRTFLVHYSATLDAAGFISRIEVTRKPGVEGPGAVASAWQATVSDTLMTLQWQRAGRSDTTIRLKVSPGAAPALPLSAGLYEQLVLQARRAGGDSVPLETYGAGSRAPSRTYLAKRGRDSLAMDQFGSPVFLKVDGAGRIEGVNGMRTTQKFMVARQATLDLETLAESFIARERAGAAAGALSSRDTARVTIGTATVWVDYGRPLARGRVILGNVVPWNEVWRTGANAATQFNTSVDLRAGDAVIPAGMYTLWTLPTPSGVKLIVNSQTGQWGTVYDPARDLVRVDLRSESLASPVDRFQISLLPGTNGAEIRIDWDRVRWVLPFTVK